MHNSLVFRVRTPKKGLAIKKWLHYPILKNIYLLCYVLFDFQNKCHYSFWVIEKVTLAKNNGQKDPVIPNVFVNIMVFLQDRWLASFLVAKFCVIVSPLFFLLISLSLSFSLCLSLFNIHIFDDFLFWT